MRFASFLFFDDSLKPFTYSITINMYNHLNIEEMNKKSIIDTAVLKEKLYEHAMKVGRISARPVL